MRQKVYKKQIYSFKKSSSKKYDFVYQAKFVKFWKIIMKHKLYYLGNNTTWHKQSLEYYFPFISQYFMQFITSATKSTKSFRALGSIIPSSQRASCCQPVRLCTPMRIRWQRRARDESLKRISQIFSAFFFANLNHKNEMNTSSTCQQLCLV